MTSTAKNVLYGGLTKPMFAALVEELSPFANFLNLKINTVSNEGKLTCLLPYQETLIGNRAIPCLHGGVVASAIDHTGGMSAWASLDSGNQRISTIDLRVDYLHPAPCKDLICEGNVVHKGKRIIFVDVACYTVDNPNKKLAIGRGSFSVHNSDVDLADVMQNVYKVKLDSPGSKL